MGHMLKYSGKVNYTVPCLLLLADKVIIAHHKYSFLKGLTDSITREDMQQLTSSQHCVMSFMDQVKSPPHFISQSAYQCNLKYLAQ